MGETNGPILDLAGLTLEVTSLDSAERFYEQLLGLSPVRRDDGRGLLEFGVTSSQTLCLWQPITRRVNDDRLARLGARGGTHVHYALQIPLGAREAAQRTLTAHGIGWQQIDLGDAESGPDLGTYFFDPFGHGLELREVVMDPADPRRPPDGPAAPTRPRHALPVVGLREVALAFDDFAGMVARLPAAYGLPVAEVMPERNFAQFTIGPRAERDGRHTPRRWLYAWDPQVGLAGMLGGEHVTLRLRADVPAVLARVRAAGLEHLHDEQGLVVRDPAGHVLDFVSG